MFENGHGVKLNIDRAVVYFNGNEEAHLKVEKYLIRGQGVEQPRISTIKSIIEVADRGDSGAKTMYGSGNPARVLRTAILD